MKRLKILLYGSVKFEESKFKDNLDKVLRSKIFPEKVNLPKEVVLYGAGSLGKMAKIFFDFHKIKIKSVVDIYAKTKRDEYKKDSVWKNVTILHPDEVTRQFKKDNVLVVCIVTASVSKIFRMLKKDGWCSPVFFYDIAQLLNNNHPLNNGWHAKHLSKLEVVKIKRVLSHLYDHESVFHFLQFLLWRKKRIELESKKYSIQPKNRFFIPEILKIITDNETFVDCGSHHGSVIEKFLNISHNKYKSILAIEPDNINFKTLRAKYKNAPRLRLLKIALSNKIGVEKFYDGFDYASRLGKKGDVLTKTTTIDSLKTEATFIKIHIEGGEFNALKGAVKTITKHSPIVVITIYHNKDGFYKIPLFMMEKFKDYLYYIRAHSWAGTGVVLYCIPKKRIK